MAWTEITNLKGPQGDQGIQGETGATGIRGTKWYSGSGAPGTIPDAIANDMYLDTDTGDVYQFS